MSLSSMYQLENLTIGLLEAINDKNVEVQESITESLVTLGKKRTQFILDTAYQFTSKNLAKLTEGHKVLVLGTIEKIIKETIDELSDQSAQQWIELASNEMIKPQENQKQQEGSTQLQAAASNLLVAIGKRFVKEVFGQLQKHFNPGQLPNLFIINTMANLAEINPYGVVPNLSGVLASMLPMLGMAKIDPQKCAFANALCKFSEAILYYCSNKEKATDKSIEKSYFSTQIYAAHEIFFNVWVKTSDNRLRQTVIEAIGHFTNLMAHEKLEADLAKIIQGFLGLYKKHPDHQIISQSLYMTITAVISASPQILAIDAIFDLLVKEMFAQVINSLEQQSAKNVSPTALVALGKNQNELLRCFAALTIRYSDRVLPFLLQKFEQNNERMRIGTLIVLKHIINSCPDQMNNKKQIVISGLRLLLGETNNRVKKNLVQIIISMAYKGYLNLEGGHLMIEFILKQCALPDDPTDPKKAAPVPDDCTNEQLRASAESVLTLFSTTVENMHPVLWPQLFEYTTQNEYTRCISPLAKNLAHIAELKRSSGDESFAIKFEQQINIPRPFEIFARLIVLCGVPLANKNRGLSILQLMRHVSPNISESIVELWDNVVPKLLANLEDKIANSKFNQKTWEELTMKMLSNSLDQINDEEKICEVAKAFGKQIETLYVNQSDEKHFAYKCLGIVLNKTASKSTIDRQLDIIFNTMNHTSQYEREGFAVSFGYAASSHLDSVLLKLETYAKNETKKSGGGLFNILKDSGGPKGDPDQIKSTIVLAYGYVTFYAPKDLVISRLEANILRSVCGYASGPVKELILKQNLLKSLDLITKCMHAEHLQREFNFSYKINILNQIIAFIGGENSKQLQNEVKSMCFKICGNIVKLNPKPTEADLFLIVKSATDSFFALAVPSLEPEGKGKEQGKSGAQTPAPAAPQEPADPMADLTQLHGNALYEQTATSLDDLLRTILDTDMSNQGLASIFKHLEPWIISVNDHERLRSIRSLNRVLKHFAANFKLPTDAAEKKPIFECFGSILGLIVSRSTDPVIAVRILTVECIESLIRALLVYNETPEEQIQSDKQFEQLAVIKQKLTKADSNILLGAVSDLSKILCKQVPQGAQLLVFIEKLIDGLLDVQSHCSSASCIFLNYCVKLRASELKTQVDNLLRHLYAKLSLIQNQQAKLGTLRTIRVLFQQHLVEALNVFLTFPIPCNNGEIYSNKSILIHEEHVDKRRVVWLDSVFYTAMEMVEICQCLCEDEKLISEILEHLLQIWNRCLPYDEKAGAKYASITPLIGTCVLNELFANNTTASTEQVFNQNFEKLFSALLVRASSTLSNVMPFPKAKDEGGAESSGNKKEDPKNAKNSVQSEYKKLDPSKISIDCFKAFIKCTQSYELYEYYEKENAWGLLGQEATNVEGCTVLARGLCLHGEKYIPGVVGHLNSFLSAPYDCQKISVTGFFAELINHKCIVSLVESLMNNLLSKLIDTCTPVRTLCIRGLGNISSLGKEEVQKHSTTILSAMMAGLDDKDDLNDDITLESMNGLAKIIQLIDENNVRPILINILLRIRPCFEKDKPSIRASAYVLFGELARFGQGPSKEPYMEQIHSNFVSFLLHLNEADDNVKRACKLVLKKVGPLMKSGPVNELFQATLIETKSLHYGEFINDLSKLLVNEFPDKVSFYIMNSVSNFKSQWNEIRCNAVLFAGYLLGHLSKDKQSVLSKEHIANSLIKLLKEDPSPTVRQKASEAISLLHEF